MAIKIVAIGKKHESWVQEGIERYQKRLRSPYDIEWVLLPHSSMEGAAARQEESERIESRLADQSYVILLDERGVLLDSPGVSSRINDLALHARHITIIIGGAYGVTEQIRQKADLIWSFSPLVFPHQLVRLLLVEQLYRAQQIAVGSGYHHQ